MLQGSRRGDELRGELTHCPLPSIVRTCWVNRSRLCHTHKESVLFTHVSLNGLFLPPVIEPRCKKYCLFTCLIGYLYFFLTHTESSMSALKESSKAHFGKQKENLHRKFWHAEGILKMLCSFLLVNSPGKRVMVIFKIWCPQLFSPWAPQYAPERKSILTQP